MTTTGKSTSASASAGVKPPGLVARPVHYIRRPLGQDLVVRDRQQVALRRFPERSLNSTPDSSRRLCSQYSWRICLVGDEQPRRLELWSNKYPCAFLFTKPSSKRSTGLCSPNDGTRWRGVKAARQFSMDPTDAVHKVSITSVLLC